MITGSGSSLEVLRVRSKSLMGFVQIVREVSVRKLAACVGSNDIRGVSFHLEKLKRVQYHIVSNSPATNS
jgi:hypothetical protein